MQATLHRTNSLYTLSDVIVLLILSPSLSMGDLATSLNVYFGRIPHALLGSALAIECKVLNKR